MVGHKSSFDKWLKVGVGGGLLTSSSQERMKRSQKTLDSFQALCCEVCENSCSSNFLYYAPPQTSGRIRSERPLHQMWPLPLPSSSGQISAERRLNCTHPSFQPVLEPPPPLPLSMCSAPSQDRRDASHQRTCLRSLSALAPLQRYVCKFLPLASVAFALECKVTQHQTCIFI